MEDGEKSSVCVSRVWWEEHVCGMQTGFGSQAFWMENKTVPNWDRDAQCIT